VHASVEPEQVAHDAGVVGGAIEGRIPGNRRDRQKFGVQRRNRDRHHVVVAWIAVEDDAWPVVRRAGGHVAKLRRSRATMAR
jgi:hypothetical protein